MKLKNRQFGDAWHKQIEDHWEYEDFLKDEHWRKDWISFDGVVYHPGTQRVYCDITSFDADIFTPMFQCHDVSITPAGVLYSGQNDHPQRSSYLWEIRL